MREGRIFAIGDIHGYINKLEAIMRKIHPDPDRDELVFLGDYVDRGPNSKEVVEMVLEIRRAFPRTVCLMGNHEFTLLDYLTYRKDPWTFFLNGGIETIHSYDLIGDDIESRMPPEHLAFFNSLRPYYETEQYIFVHAGLREGVSLQEQTLDDLVWIRREFIECKKDFGKLVIFGHTPFPRPLIQFNKIGIDTGAGYGGALTCLELPARVFHSTYGIEP
ncbi:MAG: metallophosphoesterase family protein [Thermodesulfobacteriota bacterium]